VFTVTIIAVGRLKDKFYEDAAAEYLKRLGAYAKVTVTEVRAADLPEDPSPAQVRLALEKEGESILKKLPAGALAVAMCIEGRQYSSEELAEFLSAAAVRGEGHIAFIIGGSYGLSPEVKAAARERMSMSKMTFPHRLARVMLLEQLYRAFRIGRGEKYHK
jgi:23S rRNA (pseudouridine1915-N3)-methyltransferase